MSDLIIKLIMLIYNVYKADIGLQRLFRPAKTLPPRGAGWEPGRLAFQS